MRSFNADLCIMAYVTLDEGPRILTVIVDCDPDDVGIGARVTAKYVKQERDDGEVFAVPVFELS